MNQQFQLSTQMYAAASLSAVTSKLLKLPFQDRKKVVPCLSRYPFATFGPMFKQQLLSYSFINK